MATAVVLILALGVMGGLYAAFAPVGRAASSSGSSSLAIEEGKKLYVNGCSSCHGLNGQGSSDGPPVIGVGAAAVDFQVGTGRMPAQQNSTQVPRKRVIYSQPEIDQMAAYIASLGPGPAIPNPSQYATDGDLQLGGELFRTNCASCHNFSGEGGALTYGKYAPSLVNTKPKYIYEAMVHGPQAMPVFSDGTLTPQEKKDIITWVHGVAQQQDDPGGQALGRLGPVTEGLVGWVVGLGLLIAVAVWIGAKAT